MNLGSKVVCENRILLLNSPPNQKPPKQQWQIEAATARLPVLSGPHKTAFAAFTLGTSAFTPQAAPTAVLHTQG